MRKTLTALFVAALVLLGQINTSTAPHIPSTSGTPTTGNLAQWGALNTLSDAGTTAAAIGIVATGSLSSSQILNLNTTPVTLIAAQGSGTLIMVDSAVLELVFGGTAYAAGANITLRYVNTAGIAISATTCGATFVNAGQNEVCSPGTGGPATTVATNAVNQVVVLANAGGAFTTGNGTINYWLRYRVLTGF